MAHSSKPRRPLVAGGAGLGSRLLARGDELLAVRDLADCVLLAAEMDRHGPLFRSGAAYRETTLSTAE